MRSCLTTKNKLIFDQFFFIKASSIYMDDFNTLFICKFTSVYNIDYQSGSMTDSDRTFSFQCYEKLFQ